MSTSIETEILQRRQATEYCMKAGGVLGILYIISYILKAKFLANPALAVPFLAIALSTPFALAIASRHLRSTVFAEEFSWFRCWTQGIKVIFYASLLEAAFVVIYNQWIDPLFLYEMKQNLLSQFDNYLATVNSGESTSTGGNTMAALQQMIVTEKSAIETMEMQTPIQAGLSAITSNLLLGAFWMLLFATIYKKSK